MRQLIVGLFALSFLMGQDEMTVEQIIQSARTRNPSGRLTTPNDVAQAVLALSRDGTHWITGNTIRVDGGETVTG